MLLLYNQTIFDINIGDDYVSTVKTQREPNVMWQPGLEGSLGENGSFFMFGWFPLLFTQKYHKIVNWLLFIHQVLSNFLWPRGLQQGRPPCLPPSPGVCSNSCDASVMPSNRLILCHPLLLPPSIFASNQGLFQWVGSLHQVGKVLELQLQCQSFQWVFRVDFL